jgi:hypothetical protein
LSVALYAALKSDAPPGVESERFANAYSEVAAIRQ